MRKDALDLCAFAVGYLENVYLDNPDEEPVTLEEAVAYCYDELVDSTKSSVHFTSGAYFATKELLLAEIKRLILASAISLKKEAC